MKKKELSPDERKATLADAGNQELVAGRSFAKADVRDCDLTDTDFMGCNLSNWNIAHSNLRGAIIGDSSLDDAEICQVSLNGIHIHDVHPVIRRLSFRQAIRKAADL